jgi:hypothetical protein
MITVDTDPAKVMYHTFTVLKPRVRRWHAPILIRGACRGLFDYIYGTWWRCRHCGTWTEQP